VALPVIHRICGLKSRGTSLGAPADMNLVGGSKTDGPSPNDKLRAAIASCSMPT
jgi:uncharacterized OsmC-like protein